MYFCNLSYWLYTPIPLTHTLTLTPTTWGFDYEECKAFPKVKGKPSKYAIAVHILSLDGDLSRLDSNGV